MVDPDLGEESEILQEEKQLKALALGLFVWGGGGSQMVMEMLASSDI